MGATPISAVLLLIVLTVLCGVVLLVVGLRGRRVDEHPLCRGCRFDLHGLYPGAAACPECGRALSGERAVIRGRRQRRRGMIRIGAALLVLSLGVGGAVVAGAASGWSVYRSIPSTWLAAMIRPDQASTAPRAMEELIRRLRASELDAATIDSLVETVLTRQGDASLPWPPQWGNLVQEVRAAGQLSEEQWTRYLRQSVGTPELVYRSRIRTGERVWPVGFEFRARVGERARAGFALPNLRATLVAARIGENAIELSADGRHVSEAPLLAEIATGASTVLPVPVQPGRYRASLTWEIEIPLMGLSEASVSWPQTFECDLEVVPEGTQLVEPVADESLRERIEAMLQVRNLRVTEQSGLMYSDGSIHLEGAPPMPLAFKVFLRAGGEGGREWPVGSLILNPEIGGTASYVFAHLDGLDPETAALDVILRPDPDTAVLDPRIDRIWDGELILRDVPVAREEVRDAP